MCYSIIMNYEIPKQSHESMKDQARARLEEIQANPTELDLAVPVVDEWPESFDTEAMSSYIDSLHDAGEEVDFSELAGYIRERRQLYIDARGVVFDPIDDAPFIPRTEDIWGFLSDAHKERHGDEIRAAVGPSPAEQNGKNKISKRVREKLGKIAGR